MSKLVNVKHENNEYTTPTCGRCGHKITEFVTVSYIFEGNFNQVINVAGKKGNKLTYQKQYTHQCPDPEIYWWWIEEEDYNGENEC